MRYDSIEEDKGLFTFYKEQEAEENERKKMMRRRKKGKHKSSKKDHLKINEKIVSSASLKEDPLAQSAS